MLSGLRCGYRLSDRFHPGLLRKLYQVSICCTAWRERPGHSRAGVAQCCHRGGHSSDTKLGRNGLRLLLSGILSRMDGCTSLRCNGLSEVLYCLDRETLLCDSLLSTEFVGSTLKYSRATALDCQSAGY